LPTDEGKKNRHFRFMSLSQCIADNIRKMRQEKQWSQEELAYRAGIDRSYLSEIESGSKNISVTMLERIAAALEVHPADLFKTYRRQP